MGIYTPKSVQVNFLWGQSDVRTAIKQFYTPHQKKLLYAQNKFLATPLSKVCLNASCEFQADSLLKIHTPRLSLTLFKDRDLNSIRHYRAMHFSAKRGLAIACRPSVCCAVTLVICDHIGWKSWKLTAQTISPTPLLFAAKRRSTYFQGNMEKFWRDYRGGVASGREKWRS